MTELLAVDGGSLGFLVRGTGPGVLVPWCNFPWPDMPFLDVLAEQFTLVLASPRGYQRSTRLAESARYSTDLLVRDLLAVCDHTGLETFSVLGYSLTAAMAAGIASATTRVDAIAVGGFPLLGSYERVLRRAVRDVATMKRDDTLPADIDERAVLTLYRELAERPDGALVDLACPVLAFWGTDDTLLKSFNTRTDYRSALTERGIETLTLDGCDHAGAILGLGEVIEDIAAWLARWTSTTR
jgi:pimeloyl-ACP methyl ester carboxylesterase